ncbi:MAG: CoA transferase, partial [Desulfobacteraceae bacterium]
GFGQTGPYEDKAGFDPIAQGMSGVSSVTGWKHTGPVRAGVAIGDCLAGIFAAYGIMTALFERVHSGKGQRVETSLLESLVAILGMQAAKYFGTNERPEPQGNDHALVAPYGTFRTADGFINIAAGSQFMWERLIKAMNLEELGRDSRFITIGDRMAHRPELTRLMEEKLAERTTGEWEKALNEAGVANGPILHIDEVFRDPQVLHMEMLQEMVHPTAGKIKTLGVPIKMSRTPAEFKMPPPLLGEHTDDVLRGLGYSPSEITALRAEGIV